MPVLGSRYGLDVSGRVYLVGAGPGDPELITERGKRRLGEADLVLYDALAHPALLAHAPRAEKVFVGKRAGRVAERQEAIDARMIEAARAGRTVVRLKGGDPYLFGRGSEEAEALAAAGIPFEVVPGVSSPSAAAAYAGISLTHRESSSSVAYLTASEAAGRSTHDWAKLATATDTLVVFMGSRNLGEIMRALIEHGRPSATPAAVIVRGSLPSQRVIVGTVGTLAAEFDASGAGTPALTIVGEVVRLRETLRWFDTKPLFGARVLVTRPAGTEGRLVALLRDEGAEPICVPAIAIAPPTDDEPLRTAIRRLATYAWVVLTSANGVRALFDALDAAKLDARALGSSKVLAIGPATAAALRERGVVADVVPDEFRGEAAAEALLRVADVRGRSVLLPRAEVARDALPDALRAAGANVDVVAAYRNATPDEPTRTHLASLISERAVDVVTFTAPSTVREVLAVLGADGPALLEKLCVASIGPVTTEAAIKAGVRVDVTATEYTAEGLTLALIAHVGKNGRRSSTSAA
jgi:uroporphyrinogen III methyltransferase/synthase